ncbi:MAG: glycerol kinase GlpK [Myxococcales bacterium]|nr:glycerol kinase GlpK [Myxococcales bacterium]
MTRCILAIDQGTTGTTALVIDEALTIRGRHTEEFAQIYPRPGWVEHEPAAIIRSVEAAIAGALAAADVSTTAIAAIGITNQRETTLVWEKKTGEAIHNAIVWQCRRTAAACNRLRESGHELLFRSRTGLVLDPYFSGTKIGWILDHVDGARARAERGELAFGTVDSYLVWQLTGGAQHVTDATNASRTLLMNLQTGDWDAELCEILAVPRAVLPTIRGCSEVYGTTRGFAGLPDGIPVAGIAGDQQAALFGQACHAVGDAKCTYGTGAFLLMNVGSKPIQSTNGLLTTVAWRLGETTTYALEGSAFIAGAAVQWLRDGLGIIRTAVEVEALARRVDDSDGVYFVPALTGLGAPYWRPQARGVIHGITRGTTAAHLARATLEGIAYQNLDILRAMQADLKKPLTTLKVDGGAAANDLLMQFQADLLGVELVRPALLETTALGAAFLAGLAVGVWPDLATVRATWKQDARFERQMAAEAVEKRIAGWHEAVMRA